VLKLGEKIKYNVGFNVFENSKVNTTIASGYRNNLEWVLQEEASRLSALIQVVILGSFLALF